MTTDINTIKEIARKYAESRYPECKTYDDEHLRDTACAEMEEKLTWLFGHYCIVERSVVHKMYEVMRDCEHETDSPECGFTGDTLKFLFGSQLENVSNL